ncbi:hypothetical protein K501DRAFT_279181 [Backusella circina FSU 941]|nr:hypothetical protein K501DRAFT_279181 [Backusella circina FSU 941]
MVATENTGLLSERQQQKQSYTDQQDDITVVSTSAQEDADADADRLLKSRLNGSPLFLVLCGLWVGVVLSSLDASIVATIYPQIGTEFKRIYKYILVVWKKTLYKRWFLKDQLLKSWFVLANPNFAMNTKI